MHEIPPVSIYQMISDGLKQEPGIPYAFQDEYISGADQTGFYYLKGSIDDREIDPFVVEIVQSIFTLLEEGGSPDTVETIAYRPHFIYALRLKDRLRVLCAEKLLDSSKLYALGMRMAKEGSYIGTVSLGLLIIGMFENDISANLIQFFGLHSDFTLYALLAVSDWKHKNKVAYYFAKNTIGFGKFISLQFLLPITPEQKNWLFANGPALSVMQRECALSTLYSADMRDFFETLTITPENFTEVSRILAFAFDEESDEAPPLKSKLFLEYVRLAKDCANGFADLAALLNIDRSFRFAHPEHALDLEFENMLHDALHEKNWQPVIAEELAHPRESSALIFRTLDHYEAYFPDLKFGFYLDDFIPLLERNSFDPEVLRYLLGEGRAADTWQDIFESFDMHIPSIIFEGGPQIVTAEDDFTPEFQPDRWLMRLLHVMSIDKEYVRAHFKSRAESFYLSCLFARHQDVRKEALAALRSIKTDWSDAVKQTLKEAKAQEPDPNLKRRITRLLGAHTVRKVEEVDDIEAAAVDAKKSDVFVARTEMKTGETVRSNARLSLASGSMLYLMPTNKEKETQKVLVLSGNGKVLGTIDGEEGESIINRINNQEKLYARLIEDFEARSEVQKIDIYAQKIQQASNVISLIDHLSHNKN